MAYFLPSYFQKRLLRYALSRLDFIDSDALDLDNLGVTIGQRSVIVLKNVGIRISKLLEKVDLPATIRPQHASIRLLRITIPADLHVSAIEVEIDGVEIEVVIDAKPNVQDNTAQRRSGQSIPNHRDIANRPRITSNNIHDPGGRKPSARNDEIGPSAILPAPEDLAASFLQTEPDREKRQIQAEVESRSSISGLDGSVSEDGVGMLEGFSLPGFVTSFFTGIADRLCMTIRQIAVKARLPLDHDKTTPDSIDVMLKVEEIELQRASMSTTMNWPDTRRGLRIAGLELFVISDLDMFTQKSTVSSPRLSKSRSSALSASHREGEKLTQGMDSSSSSSFTSSTQDLLSQSIHESMLGASQLFEPSLSTTRYASSSASPQSSRMSPVSTRELDPGLASGTHQSQTFALVESSQPSISPNFSQADDQSMYMSFTSARSGSERMPGGFDTNPDAVPDEPRNRTISSETLRPAAASSGLQPGPPDSSSTRDSRPVGGYSLTFGDRSAAKQKCIKRFFRLNDAVFRVPVRPSAAGGTASTGTEIDSSTRASDLSSTQYFASASHIRNASEQSTVGIPKDLGVRLDRSNSYGVEIGDVEIILDVPLCRVLLKAVTESIPSAPSTQPQEISEASAVSQPDIHIDATVHSLVINIMEIIPEFAADVTQVLPTESTFSVRGDSSPLLQLQLLDASVQMARIDGKTDSRFSLHRVGLYREAEKIVSFFDPSSIQGSFLASSAMLDPDDIIVRQLDNRFDVAVKPMHVRLDLLLLDDVLSRSGGLSSLLDLGSSFTSTNTMRNIHSRTNPSQQRRRSVHFDDSPRTQRSQHNKDTGLKLNLRIANVFLDLVGSRSSLQIRSSSIKTVYRASGLKANVSWISIKGPILHNRVSSEILTLKIGDLELAYADTPTEDDLDRLLQLLAPSSDQLEQADDDIMVDTLLRQRRKGGILRLSVKDVQLNINGLGWLQRLSHLGEEISKLSTVTKYLPEDDRPGMLTFVLLSKLTAKLELDKQFGPLILTTALLEGAHISVPPLMAMRISSINLTRGAKETLIRELIPDSHEGAIMGSGMVMCRFLPDEMEPTVKLKLSDMALEYSVPMLLAITQLVESLQSSLARDKEISSPRISEFSSITSEASELSRKIKLSVTLRNAAVSLKPLDSAACGLFVFTDTSIIYDAKRHLKVISMSMRKASLMVIDDIARSGGDSGGPDVKFYFDQTDQIQELVKLGFVPVGSISAAEIEVRIVDDQTLEQSFVEVELRNNLLVIETCADSTQTLTQILGGLSPPSAPSKVDKFRTEVVPIQDMLASWTGNAFVAEKGSDLGMQIIEEEDSTPTPSTILEPMAQTELSQVLREDGDELFHNVPDDDLVDFDVEIDGENNFLAQSSHSSIGGPSLHIAPVNMTADDDANASDSVMMHSLVDFRDDHFTQTGSIGGTAHRWDSTQNTYAMGKERDMQSSPLKVKVRDVHIIWNMFDGYDWQYTRDTISQAVQEVESRAIARHRKREGQRNTPSETDDESIVGDVLFNSIYINIPANRDPRDLTNAINVDLGDLASETGSYATSTTVTANTSRRQSGTAGRKHLRLKRSRSHKMTFELEGLAADFLTFPHGSGEIESSVDIRVRKIEVFDHIPTSRWKKFATYMHESGERQVGTDMVHIEMLNVKPVAELAASEIVLKVTVLPLRLYVDQDALDFVTRFFEFKDDRVAPSGTPSSPPFIQRAEVNPIKIRLDFKPKRVDYAGLKSGKLTEFMNFVILERSDLVLRRTILYGVSGFDRLGIMLNNIWTPDVRNNQLPGVLAGLAPIRPLVDVGSGVRDLIAVPIREYKKDGRVVRSIQKGAFAFAKKTTTELVNLGAKLAIGTQTVLQNAEDLLAPQNKPQLDQHTDSDDEDYHKEISNYADQPLGIIQGLRGAYASLERDLLLAKDAIVAVPGEIIADGSATGAAKVILKQSPTIILRPAIGVTKAVGQALLGAGNTLDRGNRRRVEDKYKSHY